MLEWQSPRCCFSTEENNERENNQTITIEGKIIPEWFYWTFCVDCREYREFTNNVCPYQHTHKVSLSFGNCRNVYNQY